MQLPSASLMQAWILLLAMETSACQQEIDVAMEPTNIINDWSDQYVLLDSPLEAGEASSHRCEVEVLRWRLRDIKPDISALPNEMRWRSLMISSDIRNLLIFFQLVQMHVVMQSMGVEKSRKSI